MSWIVAPRSWARRTRSGSFDRKSWRPEITVIRRSSASSTIAFQAGGSLPPIGAMPISSVSGLSAWSRRAMTGVSPPTPSNSPDVLPACVESNRAITSLGWYRRTLVAVLAVRGSVWPSVRMTIRRAAMALDSPGRCKARGIGELRCVAWRIGRSPVLSQLGGSAPWENPSRAIFGVTSLFPQSAHRPQPGVRRVRGQTHQRGSETGTRSWGRDSHHQGGTREHTAHASTGCGSRA